MDLRLVGDKPHLGFGILRCAATGAMFRVMFETINERPPVSEQGRPQTPSLRWQRAGLAMAGKDD